MNERFDTARRVPLSLLFSLAFLAAIQAGEPAKKGAPSVMRVATFDVDLGSVQAAAG
jgi:hypothetical protein